MKLAMVRSAAGTTFDRPRLARVDDQTVQIYPDDAGTLDDYIRNPAPMALTGPSQPAPLDQVTFDAPVRRVNRDILCTGWNYWDHFEEGYGKRGGQDPQERPAHPTFFTKGPHAIVGPTDPIAVDLELAEAWDYEVEIAVIIGTQGRSIPAERAWEHVFGMCVANDMTARDIQRQHGGQWFKGKSIDATMPIGPWVTTMDAIDDPAALELRCLLNGQVLQQARVGQMAFDIPTLIAELSWGMTLYPGDVLLTGTPAGVGYAREPQILLQPGDVLVSEVVGLGRLHNAVQSVPLHEYRR